MGQDETVASIETDKVTIPVNAPESGIIKEVFAKEGDTVEVGKDLFKLEPKAADASAVKAAEKPKEKPVEAAAQVQSVKPPPEQKPVEIAKPIPTPAPVQSAPKAPQVVGARGESREKLTRMRLRIAERMKEAQNTAASLTTFNEVDMSALMALRSKYKDAFTKKHDAKLGFMSAFIKASAKALTDIPVVNARMDMATQEIVYSQHVDISVAVATPKGLVTPVLRNCESMSFADVEKTLASLGERARDGKIALEELSGGTFTISNGGVFGSMMGTPILNAPQSAILGMHAIKERPVVVDGQIVIRPMMYLALTYDHRLIDGREAVTFLVRIKELLEEPTRFLIDV